MPGTLVFRNITNTLTQNAPQHKMCDIDDGHLGDTEELKSDSTSTQNTKSPKLHKSKILNNKLKLKKLKPTTITSVELNDWLVSTSSIESSLFCKHLSLFGQTKDFPLHIKIVDAKHKICRTDKPTFANIEEHNDTGIYESASTESVASSHTCTTTISNRINLWIDNTTSNPSSLIVEDQIMDCSETNTALIKEINSITELRKKEYEPHKIHPGYMGEYEYYTSDTSDSSSAAGSSYTSGNGSSCSNSFTVKSSCKHCGGW